jgi:hypothetical protein
MKKLVHVCGLLVALAVLPCSAPATNLTGTFKNPDGSLVNGKLILRLSQAAKLSDNSAQIVPLVRIFSITNGQLESGAFVYGNDVLIPTGTYYVARLVDVNNNLLFEQKWSITGTNLDLGTLTPTTIGVVVPDPLIRNVTTSQVVQGPVTFSSPITAFSLTMNGNLNPGASTTYDLGNPTLPWREIYTSRWNGHVQPGTATGTVTAPSTAPTAAVAATTGGSLDNTTRYFAVTLITMNGETPLSPVATFTPSTCGGGTCRISVNVAGNEWRLGAFGYRVYACTDAGGASCFRQTGFPEELDTTGPLANAHYSPGTVVLSSVTLSGTAPPSTNTAAIDADQVALNSTCDINGPFAYGTLQYRQNSVSSFAQTGTTPLVVACGGARIQGHAVSNVDTLNAGSTRNCTFSHVKLGCVMVMNVNAVRIDGLGVQATNTNGYMLNTWANSFNQIEIGNASVKVSGSTAVAPLRIKGIWYYLRFPNLQLLSNTTGTGANRGAGVLISNASGANWKFSGPVRWTIDDRADAFRNDLGHSDPDTGTSASFLAMVGEFKAEDIQIQWGTSGVGNGVLLSGGNWVPNFNRVSHSDYAPAPGTPAFIQLGADATGAGACCQQAFFANSPALSAVTNNAAWLRMEQTASNSFSILVDNVYATHTNFIDLNNVGIARLQIHTPASIAVCNPANTTTNRIINVSGSLPFSCSYPANNGLTDNRIGNWRWTGGTLWSSDASGGGHRHFYWSGSDNVEFTLGTDPTTSANRIWQSTGSKQFNFYNNAGTGTLFRVDARAAVDLVQVGSNFLPLVSSTHALGSSSLRWAGVFSTTADFTGQITSSLSTGTAPFSISSTTEVANLNAQKWHSRDAVDFSAALDFASISAQGCATLTITAAGALADNPVAPSWPPSLEAGLVGIMHITGNDTVTVRLCNITASAIDPAGRTYAGRVIK